MNIEEPDDEGREGGEESEELNDDEMD